MKAAYNDGQGTDQICRYIRIRIIKIGKNYNFHTEN